MFITLVNVQYYCNGHGVLKGLYYIYTTDDATVFAPNYIRQTDLHLGRNDGHTLV